MEVSGSRKPIVLIVDDNPTNIDILVSALKADYRLGVVKEGRKAIEYAKKFRPSLILLDIMIPGMDGYQVCASLKQSLQTRDIPTIFITAVHESQSKTKGFETGAVDYITKPFNVAEVRARVGIQVELMGAKEKLRWHNKVLKERVKNKTKQITKFMESTIQAMAGMAEVRDPYTAGHQQRVARLSCDIAKKMGLSSDEVETIRFAGLLHDIGKIRIPVSILNRPGKLMDVDYAMLQIHPQVGFDLLSNIHTTKPMAEIVIQHHERLDGSGYPHGLTSEKILMESRIVAVADVIEAMSSFRPYRPALGIKVALSEVVKKSGVTFDSDVVNACRDLINGGYKL